MDVHKKEETVHLKGALFSETLRTNVVLRFNVGLFG